MSFIIWKRITLHKGGANPTFASAKVKNAIGRIGIFLLKLSFLIFRWESQGRGFHLQSIGLVRGSGNGHSVCSDSNFDCDTDPVALHLLVIQT